MPSALLTRTMLAAILAVTALSVAASALDVAQIRALDYVRAGRAVVWPGLSDGQLQELGEKAAHYQGDYEVLHAPHGYAANLRWSDRERTELLQYDGLGDGAIWTGHYVAALALQYAVDRSDSTLRKLRETLGALDRLTRVSGREGYVARYAGPAEDPLYETYYAQSGEPSFFRPGFGRRAFVGAGEFGDLVWLGDSSRDTYDGVHFACAAVWRYVDDSGVRAQVRTIVERVGQRLLRDGFFIVDGHGNVELPNPSFYNAWMCLMQNVSPHTFRSARLQYEISAWLFFLIDRYLGPGLRSVDEQRYYPNNLDMARMFTMCTMEPNPDRREAYRAVLRKNYHEFLAKHLNAHFAAIYMLCTGDRDRGAIASLEGGLAAFPVDKFLHVPEPVDAVAEAEYADQALFVQQRPMSDFIWQRPPARLPNEGEAAREYPGIDFLLPYWMGRSIGMLN